MDYDDIVVGSGLSALGVVIGLPAGHKILVAGGPKNGIFSYYDFTPNVPCGFIGEGGLGNYWHGVIPLSQHTNFANSNAQTFVSMFSRFYPFSDIAARLGQPWLFVPWKPIRPTVEFARLARRPNASLTLSTATVERFESIGGGVKVFTDKGVHVARRIWIAAGALHTPLLLARSLNSDKFARGTVSDHVICYLGQATKERVPMLAAPRVERTRDGVFFEAIYDQDARAVCTLKPARFEFRRLDQSIEARAIFGLPTGGIVNKLIRRLSPGLLAEAIYNRTGAFNQAGTYSVYAQIRVPDAYERKEAPTPLTARQQAIRLAVDAVRANPPMPGLIPSARPDVVMPGIHLHHSLELNALATAGINTPGASVRIVDASIYPDIGCDHHSFKTLLAAAEAASHTD